MARVLAIAATCAGLTTAVSAAAPASPVSARAVASAHQGSTCSYEPYSSVAVGLVLPSVAEPDRPGPAGNEVRDIARVFYATPSAEPGFAGWLSTAFDGRRAFTPAGLASQLGDIPMSMTVHPVDDAHLPLAAWLRALAGQHGVFDPALKQIALGQRVTTSVEPCFTAAWDGSPDR